VARPAAEDDLAWFVLDAVAQMNTTLLYDPKIEFKQQALNKGALHVTKKYCT